MPFRIRWINRPAAVLILLAAGIVLPPAAFGREPAALSTAPSAVLEELNSDFRSLYRHRTRQVLEAMPLVLVVQNHTITAVRGTQRRLYPVPLQRYSDARSIVHAMLGFHGLMGSLAHAEPGAAEWAQVDAFRQNVQMVRHALPRTTLSRDEKSLALQILQRLDNAAGHAATTRAVTPAWIAQTLRPTEPLLAAFSESVGRAHAEAMSAVLKKVQADASPQEWANVVAVVTGPMTPRRNNLETAIVASVLGSEHLGTRIFYSENIFNVDGALAYLQTLAGDRELSENVFGHPHRMWEDLFAPVSRALVQEEFYTDLPR